MQDAHMPQAPRLRPCSGATLNSLAKGDSAQDGHAQAPGVCSHLIYYDKVTSAPPRPCEVKMLQSLLGLDAFNNRREGAAQAAALMHDIRYIRHLSQRSHKKTSSDLILSIFGFSSVRERNVVLRLLKYALRPRVIWAAEVGSDGSGKWEALLVLNLSKWPMAFVFGEREELLQLLEKLLENCRQSIGLLELPTWTDASTLTALQRLQAGRCQYGNLLCHMNRSYVLEHDLTRLTREREHERARLREHTDLYFNADNMIYLTRELHAATVALQQARGALAFARTSAHRLVAGFREQAEQLDQLQTYLSGISTAVNGIEMPQVLPRMQALRHAATRQAQCASHLESALYPAPTETSTPTAGAHADSTQGWHLAPSPLPAQPLSTAPPSPPGEPAPVAPVRFLRMGPHVTLRVMSRPPALDSRLFDYARGSGERHNPITVD